VATIKQRASPKYTVFITNVTNLFNLGKKRYNIHLWKCFLATFSHLPIAAVIEEKIICMHGGLSPHMRNINEINSITRPTEVPDQGLLCDLLWADPTTHTPHWAES
jgi:serine/threonine-protein phosphatase PP1 catalytic subunit